MLQVKKKITGKASSCPRQTQTPEMVLSLSLPKRLTDEKHCFLILSRRWNIPSYKEKMQDFSHPNSCR